MDNFMKKLIGYVDQHRELIETCERQIWNNPEIGYKEWKTTAYLEEQFEKLGYEVKRAGDIPGFIADLDTGKPGPKIALMGELDSLMCATHPEADPETKAVHACGHHCQPTMVLGCAAVFAEPDALEGLCGSIRFICVPAEETIDLEFRNELIAQGVIKYVAGKIEFLRRGYFDGVDMAMMIHLEATTDQEHLFETMVGCNGCLTKHFEYQGVAAHAGAAPHEGINALYAASLGLMACNSLRETFQEKDYIRFHPIITQAGVAANAIPNVAKLDAYVRAGNIQAMLDVNKKINRALTASAAAMGANLLIQDTPGNMPLHCDENLNQIYVDTIEEIFGRDKIVEREWCTGSTDVGDLSCIMPVIQPQCYGASGALHAENFEITDVEKACINPTKVLVGMVYHLLSDGGKKAQEVIERYCPVYPDKESYFAAIDAIRMNKRTVEYKEDGKVVLNYS